MDTTDNEEARRQLFEAHILHVHPDADMRRLDTAEAPGYINSCVDWAWQGFMIGVVVEAEIARTQSRSS